MSVHTQIHPFPSLTPNSADSSTSGKTQARPREKSHAQHLSWFWSLEDVAFFLGGLCFYWLLFLDLPQPLTHPGGRNLRNVVLILIQSLLETRMFGEGLSLPSATWTNILIIIWTNCPEWSVLFFFFRATLTAHGGSQARDWIRPIASGLCHSHSHTRSELPLQPTPQLMARPDP